jgi:hypothetical protein
MIGPLPDSWISNTRSSSARMMSARASLIVVGRPFQMPTGVSSRARRCSR